MLVNIGMTRLRMKARCPRATCSLAHGARQGSPGSPGGRAQPPRLQITRRTIICLIMPMAAAGTRSLGHTSTQFRMSLQRNNR